MTVKELINHLQQFEQETEVMFSYLDHTDFLYKINFYEEDVTLGDVLSDEDYDGESELFDDEDNYCGPEVVLFNLSLD
jgi:hypothetical protein